MPELPTQAEINKALYGDDERKSKYGVRQDEKGKEARTWDNVVFDSVRECERYKQLKSLQRSETVCELELQPRFELSINGVRLGEYRADFRYKDRDGRTHIEDAKGARTPLYKWKKKHVEAQYGIRILET